MDQETLEEHLAQDAPRVFLCYKNTYARENYRGGQRGESTGHQQHFVLTYRYQVERCAGPVEVQRATE